MPTATDELTGLQAPPSPETREGSPPPPRPPAEDGGGDDHRSRPGPSFPVSKERIILWLILTVVVMLFAGFSSAYIILRRVPAWQSVALPGSLWANTFVLLASSVTMEWTRIRMRQGNIPGAKKWMAATAALGLAFLGGQLLAWNQLVDSGVFVASTLHSSFLYILTGTHALHLLGGIFALAYVTTHIFKDRYSADNHEPVSLCATYWHFMDGLWVYLFLLLMLA